MPTTLAREEIKEQYLEWLNSRTWFTVLPEQVTDITDEPMLWVPYHNPETMVLYRAEVNFILFTIRLVVFEQPDQPRTDKMSQELDAMRAALAQLATPIIGSPDVAATMVDDQAPPDWARDRLARQEGRPRVEPSLHP